MANLTYWKPKEEIDESLHRIKSMYLFRCTGCTGHWWQFDPKTSRLLKKYLEKEKNIKVTGSSLLFNACVPYGVRSRMKQCRRGINNADAIGVVACPVGVDAINIAVGRKKKVIPFMDFPAFYLPAWYNYEKDINKVDNLLLSPCVSSCGACVLGITEGICTLDNCPQKLRLPCRNSSKLTKECKEEPGRMCPFWLIREKGLLENLYNYEKMLKNHQRTGVDRKPLIEIERPLANRKKLSKKLIGWSLTRMSIPFGWMTAMVDQSLPRKVRFK